MLATVVNIDLLKIFNLNKRFCTMTILSFELQFCKKIKVLSEAWV